MDSHSQFTTLQFTTTHLIELYEFWFLPDTQKFCFNTTPEFDKLITEKYQSLMDHYTYDKIPKHELNNITEDYRKAISLIILHDQIPRHIYRTYPGKINYYLELIIDFAEKTYTRFRYDLKSSHFCFVLLPLRHLNNFAKIMYIISETKIMIKNNPFEQEYKRFLKATLERYIKLNDDNDNIILQNMIEPMPQYIQDDTQICEQNFRKYHTVNFSEINLSSLPDWIKNMYDIVKQNTHIKKGIISLSGGVDSMILSYILKHIGIDISAIHINYNNRPECEEECNILRQWCSFIGIKLYIRKITEIQRPEMMELNMRDLYESYTRDIRFNTYVNAERNKLTIDKLTIDKSTIDKSTIDKSTIDKSTIDKSTIDKSTIDKSTIDKSTIDKSTIDKSTIDKSTIQEDVIVFLGHNNDDQFENIFTNIVSQSHFDNLRGMETLTLIKFKTSIINFVRPMLNIPKSDIYKFSSYFSIPHFKDSTPKWSQRGKIRDTIRPNIEQWDDRAIQSFFNMSDKLSDLIRIAKFSAKNMRDKIKIDGTLEIDLVDIYPKTMFEMLFEHMKIKISQKALTSFYEKLMFIKQNKEKYKINSIEKYRLNKETVIMWKNLSDNKIVIYFS